MLTLMTVSKGVDLHAVTAERVLRERLEGGDRLLALRRAELHVLWGDGDAGWARGRAEALLAGGGRYNPNKHHYGAFVLPGAEGPWTARPRRGEPLPAGWPGEVLASDLPLPATDPAARLLGGPPPDGATAVDVCAFPLGEGEPLACVLWRLVLAAGAREAGPLAELLAVARGGGRGLLLNPHMEDWLRGAPAAGGER